MQIQYKMSLVQVKTASIRELTGFQLVGLPVV